MERSGLDDICGRPTTHESALHIYVYMYICIYVYMYICIYVYMYICFKKISNMAADLPVAGNSPVATNSPG